MYSVQWYIERFHYYLEQVHEHGWQDVTEFKTSGIDDHCLAVVCSVDDLPETFGTVELAWSYSLPIHKDSERDSLVLPLQLRQRQSANIS